MNKVTSNMHAYLRMEYKSTQLAEEKSNKFKNCPQVQFWGLENTKAHIILSFPSEKKFWVDYIKENPERTFGGYNASLQYLDKVYTVNEKRREQVLTIEVAPCGSFCLDCPYYDNPCKGCPVTKHHKP